MRIFTVIIFCVSGLAAPPPPPKVAASAGVIPPRTNNPTYGLPVTWDTVPGAAGYIVYRGSSPTNVTISVTNVPGPSATLRLYTTNNDYLAVSAYDAFGVESYLSNTLHRNQYFLPVMQASSDLINFSDVPVQTYTNTSGFKAFRMRWTNWFDAWPIQP